MYSIAGTAPFGLKYSYEKHNGIQAKYENDDRNGYLAPSTAIIINAL